MNTNKKHVRALHSRYSVKQIQQMTESERDEFYYSVFKKRLPKKR